MIFVHHTADRREPQAMPFALLAGAIDGITVAARPKHDAVIAVGDFEEKYTPVHRQT